MDNTQLVGIAAAIITGFSMVPQLLKIIREKKAATVSTGMSIVLICGLALWIWYGIQKDDIPIIATNSFSIVTNLLLIYFARKYKNSA
ncbi:MAG TPA: SemiSWEET transporter [Panacibacter sp.]|nr:SemiSWEET transporter [Panacibacter sp.]HNP46445.1 SemiSWEET transporter [Panacibacter sp.]